MQKLARLLILLALLLPNIIDLQAQTNRSVIKGQVSTPGGLALEGAKVVATHAPTGSMFAAITGKDGSYRLPGLEAGGPYTLTVSLPGFSGYRQENIYLTLGQQMGVDVVLRATDVRRSKAARSRSVLVLSMDGFRWDYPQIFHTPNLDKLAKAGCRAESLRPSYPSKTFPNHYAIATGLYPDHNGIVQNSFYDPKLDRVFRMGDRQAVEDSIFWEGEAIWESAEQQGVKTASFYWVGSESNELYRPEISKKYTSGVPYEQQMDTVFKWLSLPAAERPGLVMFYFDEPDKTSHTFGPTSPETRAVVERLDTLVGRLLDGLADIRKKSGTDIDLIILSDHGMGLIPEGQQVFLEDVIDLKKIKRINGGSPVITLEPEAGATEEVYRALKAVSHIKVWKRSELPERYHYGTHIRIPELIVEADSAWGVEIRRKAQGASNKYSLGMHGYDPDNRDMHGIFYATGPSFKKGFVQPTFTNVNIYVLLARLLDIKPAKTDGNLDVVKGMLKGN